MDQLETIICGVDFSTGSHCALRHAHRIAQWNQARLMVVHVIDDSLTEVFPDIPITDFQKSTVSDLEEFVIKALGDCREAERQVLWGHPFVSLAEIVEKERGDLLVLGVHGHSAEQGVAESAGTVAKKAVRKIPGKVLLVRGDQPTDFKTILHCTDFSKTAGKAFEQAIKIAKQEGSSLEVIHAAISPENILFGMADIYATTRLTAETMRTEVRNSLNDYLASFESQLGGLNVKSTIVEAKGSPGTKLLESLRDRKADLVVVGTHGRGPLGRLLIGFHRRKNSGFDPLFGSRHQTGRFQNVLVRTSRESLSMNLLMPLSQRI
ncbi:MAG: universal stress protein [Verrucomicrobiota bacterium]